MPGRGPLWDWVGLDTVVEHLKRIEGKIDKLLTGQATGKEMMMAEREEITNLISKVRENKDAVDGARQALQGYIDSNAALMQQLSEAVAADTDVSPDIKAAADELQANTEALKAALPQVVTAIKDNTTE